MLGVILYYISADASDSTFVLWSNETHNKWWRADLSLKFHIYTFFGRRVRLNFSLKRSILRCPLFQVEQLFFHVCLRKQPWLHISVIRQSVRRRYSVPSYNEFTRESSKRLTHSTPHFRSLAAFWKGPISINFAKHARRTRGEIWHLALLFPSPPLSNAPPASFFRRLPRRRSARKRNGSIQTVVGNLKRLQARFYPLLCWWSCIKVCSVQWLMDVAWASATNVVTVKSVRRKVYSANCELCT